MSKVLITSDLKSNTYMSRIQTIEGINIEKQVLLTHFRSLLLTIRKAETKIVTIATPIR
ncbi:MAG: hypothetical protein ABIH09_01335 [Candidatus Omnitrophota bacterium]